MLHINTVVTNISITAQKERHLHELAAEKMRKAQLESHPSVVVCILNGKIHAWPHSTNSHCNGCSDTIFTCMTME